MDEAGDREPSGGSASHAQYAHTLRAYSMPAALANRCATPGQGTDGERACRRGSPCSNPLPPRGWRGVQEDPLCLRVHDRVEPSPRRRGTVVRCAACASTSARCGREVDQQRRQGAQALNELLGVAIA